VLLLAALQLSHAFREFSMASENLPEPHERSHNCDVHGDRPLAVEYAREHGDALLGESVRRRASNAAPSWYHNL
jgi:hypothetical protein